MAIGYSGTPFTGENTKEVVTTSPPSPVRGKPGPKPGAKKAAEEATKAQQTTQAAGSNRPNPYHFVIDKSLVDFLFMRQEELSQKHIVNFDVFVQGMMAVASRPLSPNAPDTLWSNFLTTLIQKAVQANSKGVAAR